MALPCVRLRRRRHRRHRFRSRCGYKEEPFALNAFFFHRVPPTSGAMERWQVEPEEEPADAATAAPAEPGEGCNTRRRIAPPAFCPTCSWRMYYITDNENHEFLAQGCDCAPDLTDVYNALHTFPSDTWRAIIETNTLSPPEGYQRSDGTPWARIPLRVSPQCRTMQYGGNHWVYDGLSYIPGDRCVGYHNTSLQSLIRPGKAWNQAPIGNGILNDGRLFFSETAPTKAIQASMCTVTAAWKRSLDLKGGCSSRWKCATRRGSEMAASTGIASRAPRSRGVRR